MTVTRKLEPRILTLEKLERGEASFAWYDPMMNSVVLSMSQAEFHALGRPGYLVVSAEVIVPDAAEHDLARQKQETDFSRTDDGRVDITGDHRWTGPAVSQ